MIWWALLVMVQIKSGYGYIPIKIEYFKSLEACEQVATSVRDMATDTKAQTKTICMQVYR